MEETIIKTASPLLRFVMFLLIAGPLGAVAGEKAAQEVIDLAHAELVELGKIPVIVEAVKTENAKEKTLDQIKEMDEQWKATPGIADYMQAMMDSECGQYLRSLKQDTPYYAEIFVTDDQGANVAITDKTSDYWQGDEAKFIESYKEGAGRVYVGDVEFDDNTQVYLVHVSVPVKDEDKVIGVMVIGIDLDVFENE